jgi:hypothetical protein
VRRRPVVASPTTFVLGRPCWAACSCGEWMDGPFSCSQSAVGRHQAHLEAVTAKQAESLREVDPESDEPVDEGYTLPRGPRFRRIY